MSTRINFISILTIAFALIILLLTGCRNKSTEEVFRANPAFTTYISAYTSGSISNQANIRILLANEYTGSIDFGKNISENLFEFSPDISGTAVWLDRRTIEFRPANRLPSDQVYKAEFHLSKILGEVPSELKTFEFGFKTIQQFFEVSVDGIKTIDKKRLRWQKMFGTLTTADAADNEMVTQLLLATQNNKKLKIHWEHEANGTTHHFTVDSIERIQKSGKVFLKWEGKALGIKNNKGEKEIEIPAIGDFKVMHINVVQSPEQYISVQFSDPVQEQQDLLGLINLNDVSDLKFITEDNEIKVYPQSRLNGAKTIHVETGIKNIIGYKLKSRYSLELQFEDLKPQVKLVGKGVILPGSKGLILPFQAVNLNAVDVKIIKIYEKNIPQFMQVNNLEGDHELKRVGKLVFKNKISLKDQLGPGDLRKWNTFSLNLADLIKAEPGAIYKVIIDIKKSYATNLCDATNTASSLSTQDKELSEQQEKQDENEDNWDYYSSYYEDYDYYDDEYTYYDYNQRDNPCHSMYYRNKSVSKNIIASDIGVIAKMGTNGSMMFVTTNLLTTKPITGAEIEIYDFQQQIISTLKTNSDGICTIDLKSKPFLIIAKHGSQRAYLKLDNGSALSLSMFDVAGQTIQKGIKGFIYSERGVWRPGDTVFMSFILEDKLNTLPKSHPVMFEFYNPLGQLVKKLVKTSGVHGFYNFTITTDKLAPTGNWLAKVKVGGATFEKTVKVETIMPNRLKINLSFGTDTLSANKNGSGKLNVKWLTGAAARNLNTKVEVILSQVTTKFKNFADYTFDNPAVVFNSDQQSIFDSKVDAAGNATFAPGIHVNGSAPGMLKASFTVRAFEEGGNFSIDRFSLPYSPFNSYVGIKVPEGNNKWTKTVSADSNHLVKIVSLDARGNPVSKNKLKVQIYKVDWRWWWQQGHNDLANYIGNTYHEPYSTQYISTRNGKGQFNFKVNHPDWGRFFIHITDEESGHSTGQTIYVAYWPGSDDNRDKKNNEGASMLSFTTDKTKYNVGDNIKVSIPSGSEGSAFISIENGSKVLNTYWVQSSKGETVFNFKATNEMAPNVYVNVMLLQPHAQTTNDLPIRMYGVLPIQVEDPKTHLTPIIKSADVWKPEENTSITVSEKDGKEMVYTIAVVDDGLLDLTKFQTPNPWNYFFANEALGVKTWDLYDLVIGAYGGELQRLLAIGGDGDLNKKSGSKANRFKPMVKFFGPFHLGKGQKQTVNFMMPQYVGSVRTMVIAGYEGAYGSAEKTNPVRKPLMVLGTLPRVVGPGESVDLPVTVFALEKNIKDVNVAITTDHLFTVQDNKSKSISFSQTGDEVINFRLKVNAAIGVGKVKITASSGSEKAVYEIEIESRNPNPKVTNVIESSIEPGKSWTGTYKPPGISGTNKGTLELSSVPPVNLGERLRYLIEYPHGCIEQTTSGAFPQLFLSDIMELNSGQKVATERNIKIAIERIRSFQTTNGGFSYWPGYHDVSEWGTTYAGHFLLEAELKGYTLPIALLDNWKRYQKQKAVSWSPERREGYYSFNDDLEQAYRLFTLALAKAPEMGAMNRLKELRGLSVTAKWRLAAAYALAGQSKVANTLVENIPTAVSPYSEMAYTYGSDERDKAMILESLSIMNEQNKSVALAKEVSGILNGNHWLSTQTTAYCLIGISKYLKAVGGTSGEMNYSYTINNNNKQSLVTRLPVKQMDLNLKGSVAAGNVNVENQGKGLIYARIILEGIPETNDQSAEENNLKMSVNYTKMDGSVLDVTKLSQGTDFIAEVTMYNPGTKGVYKQMALTQIFPSGWEIHNSRMDESESNLKSAKATYQDIRDDRVYTYFDLNVGEKKTFKTVLNSSYIGRFYLASVYCEAMYDHSINARKPGQWIEIVKSGQ
jgi:alpha-2-macroglobulin